MIAKRRAYTDFKRWCIQHVHKPNSPEEFEKKMLANGVGQAQSQCGVDYYTGVRFKDGEDRV